VFQGSNTLTLDAKGRLSVPTRHRDALQAQAQGRLTLTNHNENKCLLMYPRPTWEAKLDEMAGLAGSSGEDLRRWLVGSAQEADMDSAGRILISPELREEVGLSREITLLGVGKYFELWDTAEWKRYKTEEMKGRIAGILDKLGSFSF